MTFGAWPQPATSCSDACIMGAAVPPQTLDRRGRLKRHSLHATAEIRDRQPSGLPDLG